MLAADFTRGARGHEGGCDFLWGKAARRGGVLEGVGGEGWNVAPVAAGGVLNG